MKNNLIFETNNEINDVLNEERSIASQVTDLSIEIFYSIVDNIKTIREETPISDGLYYKTGKIQDFTLLDKTIHIQWQYFNFNDKETLQSFNNPLPLSNFRKLNDNECLLQIVIVAVNNHFEQQRFMETIQHELSHCWESINSNTNFKGLKIYNVAKQLMNDNNQYKQYIGNILYLSKKWEQRAFANGLYSYLMNCQQPELWQINIRKTQLYNALIYLKNAVNELTLIHEPLQHPFLRTTLLFLRNHYGLQFDDLIKIGNKTIKNITRIIGRTLSKVQDDYNKKFNESTHKLYNFINPLSDFI